ncbi:carbonic anhydrase [Fluviispira sanaruensis]|uniref:carbonic anhydrase n=1 Tax=Fluviispira sanaruensis TaxID=2493639 RepID=A0A4P2VNJ7_FLUSA|nr:carbonic anhydrase family protein [Fluviispira sanaruensis]BBH53189.1 carbonic anhydrase [Fluviispira sanaruensis]
MSFMQTIFKIVLLSLLLSQNNAAFSDSGSTKKPHWGYTGENGAENWGKLDESYKICSMGINQSPINIQKTQAKENESLAKLDFSYSGIPLTVLNNGHTIQVNYPKGSKLEVGRKQYGLLQFHFHTPSEHALDGKKSAMEVHFVNQNEDGSLAVIGVLMNKGKKNNALASIFDNMPKKEGTSVNVNLVNFEAEDVIPKGSKYFTYKGSLTTPPCSQIVTWYVLKEQIEVSAEQIKKFQSIFKMNARPIQALSNRAIERND